MSAPASPSIGDILPLLRRIWLKEQPNLTKLGAASE